MLFMILWGYDWLLILPRTPRGTPPGWGAELNARPDHVSEGIPGTGSGELKGTSFDNKLKVNFYFPLSPSPTESLPFTLIMDTLGQPLFILNFQVYKKFKRIQGTEGNNGRLQTLKPLSQSCQLEAHRMTLKSPRLSKVLNTTPGLPHLRHLLGNTRGVPEKQQLTGKCSSFHNSLKQTHPLIRGNSSCLTTLCWDIDSFLPPASNCSFWVSSLLAFLLEPRH